MSLPLPVIDPEVFARYAGLSLPRHVAYPMPTWWSDLDDVAAAEVRRMARESLPTRDLSLYIHVPFCERMCRFCACNRTILRKDSPTRVERVEGYLDAVIGELERRSAECARSRRGGQPVRQIHWGGGTPTYLSLSQIERLHTACIDHFAVSHDAELSIEVDPRVTTREQLGLLRRLGFNRISMGVQDFDPIVQKHVNRVQPLELVRSITRDARELGFESINFDLIYGLPYQTLEGVIDTVLHTCDLRPDRLAFYHYAQIPDRIANQRGLDHGALPDSAAKLAMLTEARRIFRECGYEFIGLDHFALPSEDLARALRDGRIHRSFQGMTTGRELDLIGVGCSAISVFPRRGYLQNIREPDEYTARSLGGDETAIRGLELSTEDAERQAILMDLYSYGEISPTRLRERDGVELDHYLTEAFEAIERLVDDGLVDRTAEGGLRLTDALGRVLMRNVAAAFDGYLPADAAWSGLRDTFSVSA
ncbi:MAG: oxygen-independent coproporphyrinogen III oxidase [Planctomycetota bacterium]